MIDKIKMYLRKFKEDALDEEIQDLIDACKADLKLAGIKVIEDDALIIRAISIYCKASFGYENKDSEKFMESYELLKQKLASCTDYKVVK